MVFVGVVVVRGYCCRCVDDGVRTVAAGATTAIVIARMFMHLCSARLALFADH